MTKIDDLLSVDWAGVIPQSRLVKNVIHDMPSGPGRWPIRSLNDLIGICVHQSGGTSVKSPIPTANYHTSRGNHLTKLGIALPSICYDFVITDNDDPVYYVSELIWRKYSQGATDKNYPADENRHFISVLVLGDFDATGYKGRLRRPSSVQVEKLELLVKELTKLFKIPPRGLFGHYHFGKSTCPGTFLQEYVEQYRLTDNHGRLSDAAWQSALLNLDPYCLPKFGVDSHWGNESRVALVNFQKSSGIRVTGFQDPVTELYLIRSLGE